MLLRVVSCARSLSLSLCLPLAAYKFVCFYINILCAAGFSPLRFILYFFRLNLIKCANCFRPFQMRPRRWVFDVGARAMLWICLYTLPLLLLLALTCYASAHTMPTPTPTHTIAALLALHTHTRTFHCARRALAQWSSLSEWERDREQVRT